METGFHDYMDGSLACEAYVARDSPVEGKRPVVLVFHTWAGQDDFARAKVEHLARLGYLGVAVDMYGKGVRPQGHDACAAAMTPFVKDRALLLRRASAAWNFARHHPLADAHRIGAIGFCFGGMCALDIARAGLAGLQGVVSFHGLLGAPEGVQAGGRPMHSRVLACHGWNDPFAKPADFNAFAAEMSAAGADWTSLVLGQRGHAFMNQGAADPANGMCFCPRAERRSLAAMADFLDECLRGDASMPIGACPRPS
jgi:dienelactone hydrolase